MHHATRRSRLKLLDASLASSATNANASQVATKTMHSKTEKSRFMFHQCSGGVEVRRPENTDSEPTKPLQFGRVGYHVNECWGRIQTLKHSGDETITGAENQTLNICQFSGQYSRRQFSGDCAVLSFLRIDRLLYSAPDRNSKARILDSARSPVGCFQ